MTKNRLSYTRYSNCFKEEVVRLVSEGMSINDVRLRYGIKGSNTVQYWIKRSGHLELLSKVIRVEMKGEQDRLKELEKEVVRLKIALADKTLEADALRGVVAAAERHYGTDLKKNSEQK